MSHVISIDTGGTFTDVVVMGPDGNSVIGKALTTHARVFSGMRDAVAAAAAEKGLTLDELLADTRLLVYGTTRATNAIVTRRVAKTAFVTTAGFPDTLVLKEAGKFDPHDFRTAYPDPYIPRRHTFEIAERMSSEGTASIPFNEAQARAVVADILAKKFEAVAVCFLWSVANGAHELAFARLLDEMAPGLPYTLSHQLIPIVREYRRASATAIDASLKPLMQQHLRQLETDLRAAGYKGEILVSVTSGGCTNIEAAVAKPIYTIGSGPAMAPISSRAYARQENYGDNVIVCDTGGTTFDVAFRGGPALEMSITPKDGPIDFIWNCDGVETAPKGVRGGQDGIVARHWLVDVDGNAEELPSIVVRTVRKGERLHGWHTSGGGYGNPLLRDPERVRNDVLEGQETIERARNVYGVALTGLTTEENLAVDPAATAALRRAG